MKLDVAVFALVTFTWVRQRAAAPLAEAEDAQNENASSQRAGKSLNFPFFPIYDQGNSLNELAQYYQPQPYFPPDPTSEFYDEFARASAYKDSPVYYLRLPPAPYVYYPNYGYVSPPPHIQPLSLPPSPQRDSPFINIPLPFVANGKPGNVYTYPKQKVKVKPKPKPKPKPDSNIYNLNGGPYKFNGKPIDIYPLRDSFNSLYSDTFENIYP